jgi:hypothetical protein
MKSSLKKNPSFKQLSPLIAVTLTNTIKLFSYLTTIFFRGLYYKSFTIVIYDRNESTIVIYDRNDSGLYYKTTMPDKAGWIAP